MMQPVVFTVQMFRKPSDLQECSEHWSGPCKRPGFLSRPLNTIKDIERSKKCLLVMVEALVNIDSLWLADYPDTPPLYKSGVVYRPELEGTEEWQDIPTTLMKGWGDCEDLAAWRTSELRTREKEKARPYIRWRLVDGHYRFHCLTEREPRQPCLDGSLNHKYDGESETCRGGYKPIIEDPSLVLGMAKWRDILARGL